ncbi:toprim domain-containing protein (plasmid) [Bernardetia sp. ABR2-2B]|uniref:toprim domain-containing protein n=1 Tax=Bernardetia sp. ABR2-2B TaxID=3127472 RepID=UPI0030D10C10
MYRNNNDKDTQKVWKNQKFYTSKEATAAAPTAAQKYNKTAQFFEKVNDFLDSDPKRLEQWSVLNILQNNSRIQNFNDNDISFYFNKSRGFWQVKDHRTGDTFSPLEYANNFLNFNGNLNDFVGKFCLNIGTLDDFLSDITVSKESVLKRIKKAKEERKRKTASKKVNKIKKSSFHFQDFTETNKTYLLEKGNISETTAKKFLKSVDSIDLFWQNSHTSTPAHQNNKNVFAVEIVKNECYKVLDKDLKKVWYYPNLDTAKEKIDKDYIYSFGLNELRPAEPAFLVGGEMDCLALIQAGYNAFTLGTESKTLPAYIQDILRSKGITEITICYDTDFTGVSNGFALSKEVYQNINFRLVTLPKLTVQTHKFDKKKKKFINAFTKEETSTPPAAVTEKPVHNDICDYISLYRFDFDLMKVLTKNWNVVKIGRYIGNTLTNNPIVLEAITSQKTIQFNSEMNTGKSTAIVELAKFLHFFLNKKIIFCTQRNILAISEAAKHKKPVFISDTFEEEAAKLESDIDNNDILYCNANNLKKLVNLCKSLNIDFHIVIDEPQLLSKDTSIINRHKVLNEVFKIIETEKTILITGTKKEMVYDNQVVNFDFISTKKQEEIETTVIVEPSQNKRLQIAIDLLLEHHKNNKKALLMVDSMEVIRTIERRLKMENTGAYIIASKKLHKKEKEFLAELNTPAENKEVGSFSFKDYQQYPFIIGTNLISTGYSVFTDKPATIINFDNSNGTAFDESTSLQLRKRIRNNDTSLKDNFKVDYIVITSSLNQIKDSKDLVKINKEEIIEKAKRCMNFCNEENNRSESKFTKDLFYFEHLKNAFLYWNEENKSFEVNYALIQEQIEKVSLKNGSPLVHKPKKIIYPVNEIEEIEEKTEEAKEEIKEEKQDDSKYIAFLYLYHFHFLCKCVNEETKDSRLKKETKFYVETTAENEEVENELAKTGLNPNQLVMAEKLLEKHFNLLYKVFENTEKVKAVLVCIDKKTNEPKLTATNTYKKELIKFELDYLFSIKNPNRYHKKDIELKAKQVKELEKKLLLPIQLDTLVQAYNSDKEIHKQKSKLELNTFIEYFFEVGNPRIENKETGKMERHKTGTLKDEFKTLFKNFFAAKQKEKEEANKSKDDFKALFKDV